LIFQNLSGRKMASLFWEQRLYAIQELKLKKSFFDDIKTTLKRMSIKMGHFL